MCACVAACVHLFARVASCPKRLIFNLILTMNREIVRRLWEIVGGNSLMNVGLDTIFYVGQLIWAGFLTFRWIDGQITHFRPARP